MSVQDYLEPAVKDFADQAKATYSAPIDTSKFTGRSFVAQEDPLQTLAPLPWSQCLPLNIFQKDAHLQ